METLSKLEHEIIFDLLLKRKFDLQKTIAGGSLQFKQAVEIEQRKLEALVYKISQMMEGK